MRNLRSHLLSNYWSCILLIMIIFFPFIILLIDGKVIYWGTASLQFIPWTQFLYDSVLEGNFPLWNPYNGLGVPFVANHQSATFYPLNWIMFPFYLLGGIKGLAIGMTLLIPVHLSIAGLGITRVLKKLSQSIYSQLIGAIVFVFSGYILTRLSFISMVWAFAWLPWIIYSSMQLKALKDRGSLVRIIILALFFALQLLTGHAQTSYYSILLGAGFLLFFELQSLKVQLSKLISYFTSVLVSLFLAAIQIFPTYEFLQNSQRSSEVGYEVAVNSSLWPGRLITVLFGNFWGNPNYHRLLSGGSFWEENIYLGVFPILFFSILFWILIRKNRTDQVQRDKKVLIFGLIGILIFTILFSFGKFFPLFPFLYKNIPTFDLFQAPSRFLIIYVFLLSLFAAIGYDLWILSKFNQKKTIIYLVIFGGLLIFSFLIKYFYPDLPDISMDSLLMGSFLGLVFGITTLLKDKYKIKPVWIHIFVLVIIIFDLIIHNLVWNNFQPFEIVSETNKTAVFETSDRVLLKQKSENFLKFNLFFRPDRIQPLVDMTNFKPELLSNMNLLNNRFKLINNFDPLQLKLFSEFWVWLNGLHDEDFEKIFSLINGRYFLEIDPGLPDYLISEQIEPKEFVQWYGCEIAVDSKAGFDQLLELEKYGTINRCLIIDDATEIGKNSTIDINDEKHLQYNFISTNKIEIDYQSEMSGWIVIRQSWYPGWRATLDGEDLLEITKVDFLFQGIRVPSGSHSIELTFFPNSIKVGLLLTGLSIIISFFIFYYSKNGKIK